MTYRNARYIRPVRLDLNDRPANRQRRIYTSKQSTASSMGRKPPSYPPTHPSLQSSHRPAVAACSRRATRIRLRRVRHPSRIQRPLPHRQQRVRQLRCRWRRNVGNQNSRTVTPRTGALALPRRNRCGKRALTGGFQPFIRLP